MINEEEPVCTICGGKGVIDVDDMNCILCKCSKRRMYKAHMGKEIMSAKAKPSPLYVLGEVRGKPKTDLTKKNLFFKSSWKSLLPHMKWVLFYKGLNFRYKVVTDQTILMVRLGKEGKLVKSKEEQDDSSDFLNTLNDLLGEQDLIIIKLGHLGYKNKSMPGYLKEALLIREDNNRPTWLVEDLGIPFVGGMGETEGHRSYSEEVAEYIADNYDAVDLGERTTSPRYTETPVEEVPTEAVEEDAKGIPPYDTDYIDDMPEDQQSTVIDNMSILSPERQPKNKFKKRKH